MYECNACIVETHALLLYFYVFILFAVFDVCVSGPAKKLSLRKNAQNRIFYGKKKRKEKESECRIRDCESNLINLL